MARARETQAAPLAGVAAGHGDVAAAIEAAVRMLRERAIKPVADHTGVVKISPEVATILRRAADKFGLSIAEITDLVLIPFCVQLEVLIDEVTPGSIFGGKAPATTARR